jgi:hypothetical protein
MKLSTYVDLLNPDLYQNFIDFNWTLLKSLKNLDTPEVSEIFSLFEEWKPSFEGGHLYEDIKLIDELGQVIGFDNPLLNNLFFYIIDNEITRHNGNDHLTDYYDVITYRFLGPDEILNLFKNKYLTNPLIKKLEEKIQKDTPICDHPVLLEFHKLIEKSLIKPENFSDFINLWIENKTFLINDSLSKWKSTNQIIQQQSIEWLKENELDDFNAKTHSPLADTSLKSIDYLKNNIKNKIIDFFIQYPEIYQEKANNKFPPIFVFIQELKKMDVFKHFNCFEKKHLEIIMKSNTSNAYNSFVEQFTGLYYLNTQAEFLPILKDYISNIFNKDLPFNELLAKSTLIPNSGEGAPSDLFENYFSTQVGLKSDFINLHLILRKNRLEDLLPKNNIFINKKNKI